MRIELKNQRIKLGLTQNDVAKQLGVSEIAIRKLENGQRNPSVKMATKLAKLYKQDYSKLFPDIFLSPNDTKSIEDANLIS